MATAAYSNDELWRACTNWLIQWEMLRPDHRANRPEACIADLANVLRDGVLLCKLLNKIDAGCIDMKDVNLKPAMAQFLSLRNINLFLKTCTARFGLEGDLFEPLMLFDLTNFHQVLCTLSKLSLSPKSKGTVSGFNAHQEETKEEEVIYNFLRTAELPLCTRGLTEPVCDATSEEIYQDLCSNLGARELQPTFEKRDFVIKELLDTENNYVDVLIKLKNNFMKPLFSHMKPLDHEIVFYQIQELHKIHADFYNELLQIGKEPTIKLSAIFMRWRERFLIYGQYCTNLTRATNLLTQLCADNTFNQLIIDHEKMDYNGKFKLRDVLSVPMQRILKYHLLLKKLIENTDPNHEEYNDLRRAREAMLDVAGYINEAARDSDYLAMITKLQESIVEWTHSSEHKLTDYGRLVTDGELKIKAHDDQKTRIRYVFIFDKCILICKQLKGQQFGYRDIINIADYHIDEYHNRSVLNKDARFLYQFHLVKNDNVMVYTIFLRSMKLKNQMIKAINDAFDNIHPQATKNTNHSFELQTFNKPVQCLHCSKYLHGLIYQGYKCVVCSITVHKACILNSGRCGLPPPPLSPSVQPAPVQHHNNAATTTTTLLNADESSLVDKLWFVGEMNRSKAKMELEQRENGTYLVRIRPVYDGLNKYALSLKTNGAVKHMIICCKCDDSSQEKKYYFSESKFFNNIEELVLNYQTNSLQENFENLEGNAKLLLPYRQIQAVAVRDLEPTDEYQLRLEVGWQVIIIGREGYREGWWKGRNVLLETGYFPKSYVQSEGEVQFPRSN